ncbi:MAG TPA: glycosyltransferase [Anaerolineales bacterium]|nr:glycosyltransferase [Anaerolineales bacterium]
MKILIPTLGSRGDVQPFIALAQGLTRAGHIATLASHPVMRSLVESHGVTFAPIGPDIDLAQEVAAIRHQARNAAIGLIKGMRFGFEMLERSHDDILAQCQDANLVVVPSAVAAGKNEAELSGLPYLSVTLMPWAIPWDDPKRPILKRMVYGAIDGLISLVTTLPLNRIRKRLGLPPVGKEGFTSTRLNLVPVSPVVFAPNPHWERQHRIVGYWYAETPSVWQLPANLLAFLDNGEPPLLINLGAMSLGEDDALENVSLFVEAIQQAGVRAIVQGWEHGIRKLTLPSTIYAAESLPHSWLLPHCAGVVHHGGFGTTAAGLRAGVPHLVIPHIADQFYWGQRVDQLGVGLPFIPRPKLSCSQLATALKELSGNARLRATASALGEQIRTENGVEKAVSLIEEEF